MLFRWKMRQQLIKTRFPRSYRRRGARRRPLAAGIRTSCGMPSSSTCTGPGGASSGGAKVGRAFVKLVRFCEILPKILSPCPRWTYRSREWAPVRSGRRGWTASGWRAGPRGRARALARANSAMTKNGHLCGQLSTHLPLTALGFFGNAKRRLPAALGGHSFHSNYPMVLIGDRVEVSSRRTGKRWETKTFKLCSKIKIIFLINRQFLITISAHLFLTTRFKIVFDYITEIWKLFLKFKKYCKKRTILINDHSQVLFWHSLEIGLRDTNFLVTKT